MFIFKFIVKSQEIKSFQTFFQHPLQLGYPSFRVNFLTWLQNFKTDMKENLCFLVFKRKKQDFTGCHFSMHFSPRPLFLFQSAVAPPPCFTATNNYFRISPLIGWMYGFTSKRDTSTFICDLWSILSCVDFCVLDYTFRFGLIAVEQGRSQKGGCGWPSQLVPPNN